jgi:hypothetical protein
MNVWRARHLSALGRRRELLTEGERGSTAATRPINRRLPTVTAGRSAMAPCGIGVISVTRVTKRRWSH